MRSKQGLPQGTGQSGVGAIGAGIPHCGGCTNAIINTPGAVPSSSIRGVYTRVNGDPKNSGGFPIPPVTNPGTF